VPRAYHIKVAVADSKRVWLSSGNWQSSNQAPFDFEEPDALPPFPLTRYNRDYHVVVRNAALAKCYEKFIEYDATLGGDFAGPSLESVPWLLLPEQELAEDFAPIKRFQPKVFKEKIRVTPLLTPDNFPGVVNKLLRSAKRRVWLQNQYIQPNDDGDNFPEFDRMLATLGKLGKKNDFDLRLCLRATDEPYRDRILAAGVSASSIRRQGNCHAKLIVIDDDIVVVGSQNLSNLGFVANRDASLAFEHAGIVSYFADVFDADWERAAPIADDDSFAVRLVEEKDEVPAGFVKVPWHAVYDTNPPSVGATAAETAPAATVSGAMSDTTAAVLDLPLFGVDPDTGKRRVESSATLAGALKQGPPIEPVRIKLGDMFNTPSFGFSGDDDQDLSEAGWGVLWGSAVTPEIKATLEPLLEHRRKECDNDDRFHEFDYVPGEEVGAFLKRNHAELGSIKPDCVPYYVLLVGGPEDIPFSFQTLFDVEYRVGRLDLPSLEAYAKYASSLVASESGQPKTRARVLHAFGAEHQGDAPTKLSAEVLVRATPSWLDRFKKKAAFGLSAMTDVGDAATKARLLEILRGGTGRPELLFTAGHGLACSAGSKRQPGEQGALVTADWDGFGGIDDTCRFAAQDLPADADVHGMVAFLFACYGVGTPATDSFPTRANQVLAPKPFCSALPKALLSHARGASLGVFGHIDRALTWSLQPPKAPVATTPFERAMIHVLRGARLGTALDDLNQRGATLASTVAAALKPGAAPLDDVTLVSDWTQQRDAAAFVLLGDPAARLKR
jgi:hypothetical protein